MTDGDNMTIGKEYSFKSQFVGKVKMKLIGIKEPLTYLGSPIYVWYNPDFGYYWGQSNEYESIEDLNHFNIGLMESLLEIIKKNENT